MAGKAGFSFSCASLACCCQDWSASSACDAAKYDRHSFAKLESSYLTHVCGLCHGTVVQTLKLGACSRSARVLHLLSTQ